MRCEMARKGRAANACVCAKHLQRGKVTGGDQATWDLLKDDVQIMLEKPVILYTKCLLRGRVLESWKNFNPWERARQGFEKLRADQLTVCSIHSIYKNKS